MTSASSCPCGSGAALSACCGPRHDGSRPAETAEALMRSRYSAYRLGLGDYLVRTCSRPPRPHEAEELAQWGRSVGWVDLQVLSSRGGPGDAAGEVHFVARFVEAASLVALEERSRFSRTAAGWRYDEGAPTTTRTKLGRNEPCPCRSGKKVKQCHG